MKPHSPRIQRTHHLVVAAWMLLAVQGAGLLHELAVQHRLCAEHGEWVDVAAGSQTEVGKSDERHTRGLNAALPQLSGDHEHCALMIAERSSTKHSNAVSIPAPCVGCEAPSTPWDPIDVARVPLLRLAPKASPPASV